METVPLRVPELPRLPKGSPLRLGNSVVASGSTAGSFTIAAGATADIEIKIVEDCHLDRLILQYDGGFPLVTKIAVDNDGHLNHIVPADIFRPDSITNPQFGHFVTKNSSIVVSVKNAHASESCTLAAGFTAMIGDSR